MRLRMQIKLKFVMPKERIKKESVDVLKLGKGNGNMIMICGGKARAGTQCPFPVFILRGNHFAEPSYSSAAS